MLHIGQHPDKIKAVSEMLAALDLHKVAVIGDPLDIQDAEIRHVSWKDSIMYREWYPMLQFIGHDTLFVWNEAMHGRNRYCLEYNCIRRYAQQTPHRLIFQHIPVVEERDDALILADIAANNPYLKEPWDGASFGEVKIWDGVMPVIKTVWVRISAEERRRYAKVKADAIAAVKRDPDIIPRRCLKYAEDIAVKECPPHIHSGPFDSKAKLLPEMTISMTDLPVDEIFYQRLCVAVGGIEDVLEKISG